jgi:transposase-like protein
MDTKQAKVAPRRTRRRHTPEFKAQVIEACLQPGVSVAAIALANGLNANYLRRWVKEYREQAGAEDAKTVAVIDVPARAALVPVTIEARAVAEHEEIRLDIRRGQVTVQMAWPAGHATTLGRWLKDLLQ